MTKKDNVISLFGSNRSLIKSPPLKTKNFCLLNSPPTLFCTKTAGLASRARGEGEGRKKKKKTKTRLSSSSGRIHVCVCGDDILNRRRRAFWGKMSPFYVAYSMPSCEYVNKNYISLFCEII